MQIGLNMIQDVTAVFINEMEISINSVRRWLDEHEPRLFTVSYQLCIRLFISNTSGRQVT